MTPGRRRLLVVVALGAVVLLVYVAYQATRSDPRPSRPVKVVNVDLDGGVEIRVQVIEVDADMKANLDAGMDAQVAEIAVVTPSDSLLQTASAFKSVTDRLTRSGNKALVASAKKALQQARTISDQQRAGGITDREAVLQLRDLEVGLRREAEAAGESP